MERPAERFAWPWLAVLLLAVFAAAVPQSAAAQQKTPFAAEDVFQIEYAAEPQISPDGTKIVYVRRFADIMTDRNYGNLWLVNFDGTGHRPLTTGNFSDGSPRWSPDGTRIAFTSDRAGQTQIWVLWLATGQMQQLTHVTEAPSGLAWSPDGKWISFSMLVPEAPPSLARLPKPPEGAKWAEPARVIDRLVYRFNGPGYLKPGYYHLFVIPSEGGTPRQISSGNFHHGGPGFRASDAVWTPDSKYLIVSANRRPDFELEPLDTEVYEFSVETGAVRALTSRRGPDNSPQVSPDGRYIAYLGFDDRYQGHQNTLLYVMNRDGTGSRAVSASLDREIMDAQWAGDSRGLFIAFEDSGVTRIEYITLEGARREVARNLGSGQSAYSGGSFSVARNGNLAYTYSRPDHISDVAVATAAGAGGRVITAINDDLMAQRQLGAVEEIWYESSKDGRRIQGWLIHPPSFDPSKKYPLILEIHGGPFADYGARFDIEKQVMAAQGYVVLYTNPRGSTGYGEEFGNLIHHAYPGDDFYDLNSGVDAALARGYIDPNQLYVTGGSGGGVLTCWMIGRTDRFRAAVTVYPVINWYSWVLTADIASFGVKYWFPGLPWDHAAHYESRSLLSVVKNVKTPTMVLTGEEDYRTPMSESEQYYTALKLLGVPAVLVRVPGEPHGIRRRPSHHISKMLHILGWFEKYRAP